MVIIVVVFLLLYGSLGFAFEGKTIDAQGFLSQFSDIEQGWQELVKSVNDGDRIYFKEGTYHIPDVAVFDKSIEFYGDGTDKTFFIGKFKRKAQYSSCSMLHFLPYRASPLANVFSEHREVFQINEKEIKKESKAISIKEASFQIKPENPILFVFKEGGSLKYKDKFGKPFKKYRNIFFINEVSEVKGNKLFFKEKFSLDFPTELAYCAKLNFGYINIHDINFKNTSLRFDCLAFSQIYNLSITAFWDTAITLNSLYKSKIHNLEIKNPRMSYAMDHKDPSLGLEAKGYGIRAFFTSFCEIFDVFAEECRHGIDLHDGCNNNRIFSNYVLNSQADLMKRDGKELRIVKSRQPLAGICTHGKWAYANSFFDNKIENNLSERASCAIMIGHPIQMSGTYFQGIDGPYNSVVNNKAVGNFKFGVSVWNTPDTQVRNSGLVELRSGGPF